MNLCQFDTQRIEENKLNWYFIIAVGLLTLNAMLYTHSVLKEKEDGWKGMLLGGITAYLCFFFLMYKMSNFSWRIIYLTESFEYGKILNRQRHDGRKVNDRKYKAEGNYQHVKPKWEEDRKSLTSKKKESEAVASSKPSPKPVVKKQGRESWIIKWREVLTLLSPSLIIEV